MTMKAHYNLRMWLLAIVLFFGTIQTLFLITPHTRRTIRILYRLHNYTKHLSRKSGKLDLTFSGRHRGRQQEGDDPHQQQKPAKPCHDEPQWQCSLRRGQVEGTLCGNVTDAKIELQRYREQGRFSFADPIKPKYFLTEALLVRIYATDKAKWSLKELKQWIHYLLWAGVEHIYLCDHNKTMEESLQEPLRRYIDRGLITYIQLKSRGSSTIIDQMACYQHIGIISKMDTVWQLQIDMDEYPFVMNDQGEGFLVRYLRNFPGVVTEVSMHNYLMLGQGDRNRTTVIDRINRSTPKKANNLDKPITKPGRIGIQIHHNHVMIGRSVPADDKVIRMIHYWGGRLQNWGPDTQDVLNKTVVFNEVRNTVTSALVNSLLCFGETDAFSNISGP